jgi:hypothetical protein
LYKVDGGSENTAKAALAISELLVARRLTRKIVLTRLMVGHTHEDIDAVFALIWQLLKNKKVLTPQLYAQILLKACNCKAPKVNVYDVWAVPNYLSYIEDFIYPSLGRYAKGMITKSFTCNICILFIKLTHEYTFKGNGRSCRLFSKQLMSPMILS